MRGFDAAYGIQTGLGQPGRESRNGEALSKFRFKLDIVSRRLWALAAPRKWILLFGLLLVCNFRCDSNNESLIALSDF